MIDARLFTGLMKKDVAPELLGQGDYIHAENISNGSSGVKNLQGNRALASLSAPVAGSDWICGRHHDKTRGRVIYFIFNSSGYHRIVKVDTATETATVLFTDRTNTGGTSIFNWGNETIYSPNKIIKDIHIYYRDYGGDLVYFIDPLKRPLKFNIDTLSSGGYGTATLDMFKVLKVPPLTVPVCSYANDSTRTVNNLRKKLFTFSCRFVYDDEEKSVCSPKSAVPLPPKSEDGEYYADGTKANVISVSLPTGISTVKKIEVLARVNIGSNWSDWFLVETLDKAALSIGSNSIYTYNFYNDGAYKAIPVDEAVQLFDYVPDEANTMALVNGNSILYGGITEGFNKEVQLSITKLITTAGPTSLPISYTVISSLESIYEVGLVGTPNGDTFTITVDAVYDDGFTVFTTTVSASYTALPGDTINDIIDELVLSLNTNFPTEVTASNISGTSIRVVPNGIYFFIVRNFTIAGVPVAGTDSVGCLKWLGKYAVGIGYYNENGKTRGVYGGVNNSLVIDIPKYSEVSTVAQVASVTFSISNAPPSWATHWFPLLTKELTTQRSLMVQTELCEEDTDYAYISIQNLIKHADNFPSSASIIAYDFAEGDRIRFIKNETTSTILDSKDYEILGVVDRTISATVRKCIKLKKVSGMPSFATSATKFFVELFTPAAILSQTENVYYEIGQRFPISIDVNGNRVHGAEVQSQVIGTGAQPAKFIISKGDFYCRNRTLTVDSALGTLDTFTCMDSNFSDFWSSAVWSNGRPLVIDESIRKQYYPALKRFSLSYIYGTNINNLSRFYFDNFEEADASYGDILRFSARENFIRMFQRYKVGMIPVYRQIITDGSGSGQLSLSERLINKPNYYAGDYGIDKYGSSLISTDYGDYFLDTDNKAFIRASLDGITNIGEVYDMGSWFSDTIKKDTYGIGSFDSNEKLIVISVGRLVDGNHVRSVLSFSEEDKGFKTFYTWGSYDGLLYVNGTLWSFGNDSIIRIHDDSVNYNRFSGTQRAAKITTVFNSNVQLKKTFLAVEQLSNGIWTCVINTGPLRSQQTDITKSEFQQTESSGTPYTIDWKESKFNATIKRDQNSAGGKYFGDPMKGLYATVEFSNSETTSQRLISVSLKYIISQLTNV